MTIFAWVPRLQEFRKTKSNWWPQDEANNLPTLRVTSVQTPFHVKKLQIDTL